MIKYFKLFLPVMAFALLTFPFVNTANAHPAFQASGGHPGILLVDEIYVTPGVPAVPDGSQLDRDLDASGIPHADFDRPSVREDFDTPVVPDGSRLDKKLDRKGIPHQEY